MPNVIELNLLENKSIVATMQGIPLANENSYKIIAGEENSTKFIIKSIPNQYANARLTVEMVNAKGYGVAETDINEIDVGGKGFALPVGMAVAGYGYVSIKAYIGDEVAVFQPLKLKVWNTIPQWQDYVDKTANDFFMQDETATVLTFEFGAEGGSVTLDLAKTKYSSVYFDQYARIPKAGNTTVSFSFASGRHYVTLINNTALAGVNYSSFITVGKKNLIAVKISTLVNDIGVNAFSGCTALRKLEIPLSASGEQRRICDGAFYDCHLEEVKIPEGFTEVGYDCFDSVTAEEIELPTTLNAFAGFAFNSSHIKKIICKATNPVWTTPEEESPFTSALLIVPHDSVETYKSVFGYDKVEAYAYQTDIPNAKWKLLGETEITQEMVDQAGETGIVGVVIDLGAPIEKWYGETWVRAEFGKSAELNSADYGVVCGFGVTETEATSSADAPCHICKSQTGTYAPMYRNQKNEINLFTNWNDNLPRGTLVQVNGYSAGSYPVNAYATSNNEDDTIIGKRYMGLTGYNRAFKFPVGTKLKLYGRF